VHEGRGLDRVPDLPVRRRLHTCSTSSGPWRRARVAPGSDVHGGHVREAELFSRTTRRSSRSPA